MTELEAKLITGGLSHTSKMPCPSFSLPASACVTGAKLATQDGTLCKSCYAKKGNYTRFRKVAETLQTRLDLLEHWMEESPRTWVEAMTTLIQNYRYFRWHDSGDVQSRPHWEAIKAVARALPDTRFWLPTHEVWVAKNDIKGRPGNLLVRLSATKVDGPAARSVAHTSTVYRDRPPRGEVCPAPQQGNQCGNCRKCWDRGVLDVSYALH